MVSTLQAKPASLSSLFQRVLSLLARLSKRERQIGDERGDLKEVGRLPGRLQSLMIRTVVELAAYCAVWRGK